MVKNKLVSKRYADVEAGPAAPGGISKILCVWRDTVTYRLNVDEVDAVIFT